MNRPPCSSVGASVDPGGLFGSELSPELFRHLPHREPLVTVVNGRVEAFKLVAEGAYLLVDIGGCVVGNGRSPWAMGGVGAGRNTRPTPEPRRSAEAGRVASRLVTG